jgi:hypothetical protein
MEKFVMAIIPISIIITNDNEKITMFFANDSRSFLKFSFYSR